MANVLLAQETIYAEDIALVMAGKSEKEVIAQIEKREKEKQSDENKNKADGLLASLEPLLTRSLETAKAFKEANLITDEKIQKLTDNFAAAKRYAAEKVKMPPIPTLDNIDKYETLLAEAAKPAEDKDAENSAAAPKKTGKSKSKDKTADKPNDKAKDKPNAAAGKK
jgi:hypothetical protein